MLDIILPRNDYNNSLSYYLQQIGTTNFLGQIPLKEKLHKMNIICNVKNMLVRVLTPIFVTFTLPFLHESYAQDSLKVSALIKKAKQTSYEELMNAQSNFKCPNDTIYLGNRYLIIRDPKSGIPAKQFGPTRYEISAAKLWRFGIEANTAEDMKAFAKMVESTADPDTCKCDGTSSMSKWFYKRMADSLKDYAAGLSAVYHNQVKEFDGSNVIFETIQSSQINSDCQHFGGKYVIFLNDRLMFLCQSMSALVLSVTTTSTIPGNPNAITIPPNINDSIKANPSILSSFVAHALSFHYSCSPGPMIYENKVEEFSEYMELFVMAHEYAHALFNDFSQLEHSNNLSQKDNERRIWLNNWMNEIKADIYAQNILVFKYRMKHPTYQNSMLLSAGSFYLACAEVLENSLVVIKSGDSNAYDFKSQEELRSKKLLDLIAPFPLSLKDNVIYDLKPEYISLIDQLMTSAHPSPRLRAWVLSNALATQFKQKPKIRDLGMQNLLFVNAMSDMLQSILFSSKNYLIKIYHSQAF